METIIIALVSFVFGVVVSYATFYIYKRNVIIIPPNKAGIFFGYKDETKNNNGSIKIRNYRIIIGEAKFRIPFFERVIILDLEVFKVEFNLSGVYMKNGIPTNITGSAFLRIKSDEQSLKNACESILGKYSSYIENLCFKLIEHNLRRGALMVTLDDLDGAGKNVFTEDVLYDISKDLSKFGIGIDSLILGKFKAEIEAVE
jgi:flotillin